MQRSFGMALVAGTLTMSGCLGETLSDVGPPEVTITAPTAPTVTGNVEFAAAAVDDIGVTKVIFLVGDQVLFEDTALPWTTRWDTAARQDGQVTIRAQAFDAVGNIGNATLNLTVNNIPD